MTNYFCEVTFADGVVITREVRNCGDTDDALIRLKRMLPSVRFVPGVVVSVCIYPEEYYRRCAL